LFGAPAFSRQQYERAIRGTMEDQFKTIRQFTYMQKYTIVSDGWSTFSTEVIGVIMCTRNAYFLLGLEDPESHRSSASLPCQSDHLAKLALLL
jgi:hypothetical protein